MPESSKILHPTAGVDYPTASHAAGSYLYDPRGRAYLDGCSSAIVTNIGHSNPDIVAAMKRQLDVLTFSYRSQFTNRPAEELAARLVELAPGDLTRVQFTNSGSEAVEAAIRLALQYWRERGNTRKRLIVSREVSYHGATLGGLAVSGHAARRKPIEGLLPTMPRAAAAHCHRCPFGLSPDICGLECADDLEAVIARVGADQVAAFIFEPVVGAAGGAIPAPPGYLARVAEICERNDVLLIADEVITGLGRTGAWFGCATEGIEPDLIALGKGMSAGYIPLGAVLVGDRIRCAIEAGSGSAALGHTYSGNPLAAATGLAVIDYLTRHDLVTRAGAVGARLKEALRGVLAEQGIRADVRGRGLLLAVDFSPPVGDPSADSGLTATEVVEAAFGQGLILYPAGVEQTARAVVVAPPLTISDAEVAQLVAIFAAAVGDLTVAAAARPPTAGRPSPAADPSTPTTRPMTGPADSRGPVSRATARKEEPVR